MEKQKDIEQSKSNAGRPSDFNPEFIDLAYNYCLLGATDKDLANFFNVCEATINNWKNSHPEFLETIKKGKEIADAHIASKLFNRAEGAEITRQQAFKVKEVTYNNGKREKEIERLEVVELKEQIAPDTTAAIFWLKNRHPSRWKDKQEVEQSGNLNISWNEEKTYEK